MAFVVSDFGWDRRKGHHRPDHVERKAFSTARGVAKYRGIAWNFTFEEWLKVWQESGKWDQRGCRRGQYVMARHGDVGPYELGNVSICLAEDNRAERNRNYPLRGPDHPHYGKNPWLMFKDPASAKEKKRQSMIPVAAHRQRDERGQFV